MSGCAGHRDLTNSRALAGLFVGPCCKLRRYALEDASCLFDAAATAMWHLVGCPPLRLLAAFEVPHFCSTLGGTRVPSVVLDGGTRPL